MHGDAAIFDVCGGARDASGDTRGQERMSGVYYDHGQLDYPADETRDGEFFRSASGNCLKNFYSLAHAGACSQRAAMSINASLQLGQS